LCVYTFGEMSNIIPAGKIEVLDPPEIQSIQLIRQIVENVGAQIALLDSEIKVAQTSDRGANAKVSMPCLTGSDF
jgi:hypothetical protein